MTDDDEGLNCSVCGMPVRYGSRHHQCGSAVMAAEAAARAASTWRDQAAAWLRRKADASEPAAAATGWANPAHKMPDTSRRLAEELDAEVAAAPGGCEPWDADRDAQMKQATDEPRHDYPACALFRGGKCTCDAADDLPTPQMCRAAVEYLNGADVYSKLPAKVLEIEESIYAEVWTVMQAKAPFETSREREVREACSELRRVMGNPVISGRGNQTFQGQIIRTAASKIDTLRLWVKQADERGDAALRRAHAAEAQLERSARQLRKWAEWYGSADHAARGQLPLPPAGDVELAEDIAAALGAKP